MIFSICICLAAFVCLLWVLRRDRVSLGLPVAYLASLLLIHVPGAFAHAVNDGFLFGSDLAETGIDFTAIGAVCFVTGVWLARLRSQAAPFHRAHHHYPFWIFCVCGGWLFVYGLSSIASIPTIGAAIEKGGAIWLLGVLLGLRFAVQERDLKWAGIWMGALAVYPTLMLLLGGFLSYGSAAVIIVCSVLAVSVQSGWRVTAGTVAALFLGLSIFVNYYGSRDLIRQVTWSNAALEQRIDVVGSAFADFELFDPANRRHLVALDQRLNQNYFVGLAAERLGHGHVDYLYGRSLWEALLSLVPRALWPDKPVFGGSGDIVRDMTGLQLSRETSWGVGNVMEFHINFGSPGLIIGFLVLGWLLGTLDRKAAVAEARGNLSRTILFFLPAAALIQPNGSLVELVGGSAAALAAAYGWVWVWRSRFSREAGRPKLHGRTRIRGA